MNAGFLMYMHNICIILSLPKTGLFLGRCTKKIEMLLLIFLYYPPSYLHNTLTMASAPLRDFIFSHRKYRCSDVQYYYQYADNNGWDLDYVYSEQDGRDKANVFMNEFLRDYGITALSAGHLSSGIITIQTLHSFLTQLLNRNPSLAHAPVSLVVGGEMQECNAVEIENNKLVLYGSY